MADWYVEALGAEGPLASRRALLAAGRSASFAIDEQSGALLILGYRDVERLLLEPRLRGTGLSLFDFMGIFDGPLRDWYGHLMFTTENRTHHRLRSLVGKAFSPRSVEMLRPVAAAVVEARLERVKRAGGGDLTEALADVPMQVMCALVGVPAADVPSFIDWVNALGPTFGLMNPIQIEAATDAIGGLLGYVTHLCEARDHTPSDDLISRLLAAEHEGDRLTREETAAMVANLLVGGHDTTSSQIGCSLLTLLQRPEVLARLDADGSRIPAVVDETIRFEPGITLAPRTVGEPIEINGVERAVGSMVWCVTSTANRDATVWHDPETFDPDRFLEPDAPRLLTFGGGPHHCLGAWLARLTLEETVRGVASRAPSLTVLPEQIAWVTSLGSNPASLPVSMH